MHQVDGKASPAWTVGFPVNQHHNAPLRLEAGGLLASPYTQTVMRISCTVVLVSNNNGYTSILIQHALEASVHASMT